MVVRSRFSIATLMAVVFFVASSFAIIVATTGRPDPGFAVAVTTLPMINILLLTLPRLKRRDARPFWLGFEVVGCVVVVLAAILGWFHQVAFFSPMAWIDRLDLFTTRPGSEFSFLVAIAVVLYTLPQVRAAAIGGWLSARYRVVLERRS